MHSGFAFLPTNTKNYGTSLEFPTDAAFLTVQETSGDHVAWSEGTAATDAASVLMFTVSFSRLGF